MVSFKLFKNISKMVFEYINFHLWTSKPTWFCLDKTYFWGKLHLFLTFFFEFFYLFLLFALNIRFLSSLLSCYMSLFFSACFNIPDQVHMVINLNNQHMMSAWIVPMMVFTADTLTGSSVLKHIMSEIEPWLCDHTLLFQIYG